MSEAGQRLLDVLQTSQRKCALVDRMDMLQRHTTGERAGSLLGTHEGAAIAAPTRLQRCGELHAIDCCLPGRLSAVSIAACAPLHLKLWVCPSCSGQSCLALPLRVTAAHHPAAWSQPALSLCRAPLCGGHSPMLSCSPPLQALPVPSPSQTMLRQLHGRPRRLATPTRTSCGPSCARSAPSTSSEQRVSPAMAGAAYAVRLGHGCSHSS